MAILVLTTDIKSGPYLILLAAGMTIILCSATNIIPIIFLISLMTTSFFSIEIFEGHLRLPFILNFFVLFSVGFKNFQKVFKSRTFNLMLFYYILTLIVTIFTTHNIMNSLRIAILPGSLLFISANVAVILLSKKVALNNVIKIVFYVLLFNMTLGMLQYLGYFMFGINLLNLNSIQWTQISIWHRMTATFWEGDTFGKYLMAIILLFIPLSFNFLRKHIRNYFYIILFAILVLLLNKTRSAWVGILSGISLSVTMIKTSFIKKSVLLASLICIAITSIYVVQYFEKESILEQKFMSITTFEKIREDPSGGFRIKTIEDTWGMINEDMKTLLFGHGYIEMGESWTGVSNIFLHVWTTSGLIGVIFFIASIAFLFYNCFTYKMNLREENFVAQGLLLSMTGMIVASLLAPMFIDPIFWMIIGFGIYFEIRRKNLKSVQP